jgi:hypothetical protein
MKKGLEKKWRSLRKTIKKGDCGQPKLATPLFFSAHDILKKKVRKNS